MRSQRLSRRILSTDAFDSPPWLPYKFGKRGGNGSEIATYSENDAEKYNPLPVSPHPEIPACSSSLPCTEPESSRDDQTESDSLGPPIDGPKEEQSEMPLAIEPDDMTGKHRDGEHISLKRAQVLEEGGMVVPKRGCLVLKSPPADTRVDKSGEPHPVMQQSAVADRGGNLSSQADVEANPEKKLQHKSPFVRLRVARDACME